MSNQPLPRQILIQSLKGAVEALSPVTFGHLTGVKDAIRILNTVVQSLVNEPVRRTWRVTWTYEFEDHDRYNDSRTFDNEEAYLRHMKRLIALKSNQATVGDLKALKMTWAAFHKISDVVVRSATLTSSTVQGQEIPQLLQKKVDEAPPKVPKKYEWVETEPVFCGYDHALMTRLPSGQEITIGSVRCDPRGKAFWRAYEQGAAGYTESVDEAKATVNRIVGAEVSQPTLDPRGLTP